MGDPVPYPPAGMQRWWHRRGAPWAIFVLALCAWVPLAFVWYAVGPQPGDAGINCGGIGWGEQPCGWDAVGLLYFLFGIPFAGASLLLLTLLELFGTRAHRARLAVSIFFLVAPWSVAFYEIVSN